MHTVTMLVNVDQYAGEDRGGERKKQKVCQMYSYSLFTFIHHVDTASIAK